MLTLVYLLAGALHGVCGLDVTNPSGGMVVSDIAKGEEHRDKGVAAEHHCHGCFSVSVPSPVQAWMNLAPRSAPILQRTMRLSGLVPGIDTPPPKHLI
ncbi:hypothetical protein [Bradyrhizobium sp. STM 3562]|uniref:hypothetical protein n=1 Tax=Bradyrhizobium sp. STM 3562 TaxID=578924 RepID=UPI00388FA72E